MRNTASCVNADLFLGSAALFQLIVVALVGGSARPWGSLVGALVITELSYYLTRAAGGRPGIGPLTFAGAFFLMALLMPRGISGTWSRFVSRWTDPALRSTETHERHLSADTSALSAVVVEQVATGAGAGSDPEG